MHPRQPLSRTHARDHAKDGAKEFHIVNVFKLPPQTTQRELRKVIGRATYHMQRDPPIRFSVDIPRNTDRSIGKVVFAKAIHAQRWLDRHGDRFTLHPIDLNGSRLGFAKSNERVDPFLLQAIQLTATQEEIDSDYDEGGDGQDHSKVLNLSLVECGAFDDDGRFSVGWSQRAKSRASSVSFDVDEARLRIRCESLVIQSTIYDIRWIFTAGKPLKVYFEFKQPPIFLREIDGKAASDDLAAWRDTAPANFVRRYEQYKRVSAFDRDHAACVQHGTVYRIHLCQVEELIPFFKSTKGRLCLRAKVSELPDGEEPMFDSSGVDKMLEKLDFKVAFQAQALLGPNKLLPRDLIGLKAEVTMLQKTMGSKGAAEVLRNLRSYLCIRGPLAKHEKWPSYSMKQVQEYLQSATTAAATASTPAPKTSGKEKMMIHSAFLTPSHGIRLDGPHPDDGNRILRSFPGQDDNFIRIHLTEEDCSTFRVIQDYGSIDSEEMMHARFGNALRNGIMVGGRKFYFLAFSGSSLREHSCWFVRNFKVDKVKVKASTIRAQIGSLDHLRSPARYAARLGQAFTATSISIAVRADDVITLPDIKTKDDKYEFSDGVGRMSQDVCNRLNAEIFRGSLVAPSVPPSAFQIRMGGAKGMLSLDPNLKGEQVILRKSMVKFHSEPIDGFLSLEVAHFYTKPVPTFLNRPMVALLESLGVEAEAFERLQQDALQALQEATTSVAAANVLHQRNGVGRGSNVEAILHSLEDHGINTITQIPFLHNANMSLVNFALRSIKYRARIRVPLCHTVVGVMDETNVLAENQIIVCINEAGSSVRYLTGRCLLGRSPMLAPGDLQYCTAVEPPRTHPLRPITNAVIFSQKGSRPVPNMLSGGDLDGDLFNVLQHPDLMPDLTCEAAEYGKSALVELKRPCTVDDVVDVFLDYIKMDKLGLIATRHLELSDRSREGVLDPDCLRLAAMHSIAVDFCKSGILPAIRLMPRAPRQKPDYRKPEFRNEDRSEERVKRHPRSKDIYYPSKKALGRMFRGIDVYRQTKEWDESSNQAASGWQDQVWDIVTCKERGGRWRGVVGEQRMLVEEYYSRLQVIAEEHCPEEKGQRLEEEEVFMGHVICRGPHGSRMSPYDVTNRLQDDFQVVCHDIRKRALFAPVKVADEGGHRLEKSVVWGWIMTNVGKQISPGELRRMQVERGDEEIVVVQKQLEEIVERGVAWMRAALDSEQGGSAPWIILPSLLAAHACLDLVEANLQQQGKSLLRVASESDDSSGTSVRSSRSSTGTSEQQDYQSSDNFIGNISPLSKQVHNSK